MRTYQGSVLEQAPNFAEVSRTLEAGTCALSRFRLRLNISDTIERVIRRDRRKRERERDDPSALRSFGFSQPDDEDEQVITAVSRRVPRGCWCWEVCRDLLSRKGGEPGAGELFKVRKSEYV